MCLLRGYGIIISKYMQEINTIFYVIVLIMSVVVHEVSHGYAAYFLGDQTAKMQGRLTLNPIKHLDLWGSVLIPLIFVLSQTGFIFGWAKPVPFNPANLRDKKWGTLIVAAAGVAANLCIAIIFGLLIRFSYAYGVANESFLFIASTIVLVNIVLAIFNLVPIPPLDGSKIFFSLLPARFRHIEIFMERYALVLLLVFVFVLWRYVAPIVYLLFSLFTGMQ